MNITSMSGGINELAKALATAQGSMKDSPMSGRGNYGAYSTLADCLSVLRDVLSKNGLSVVQLPKTDADGCHLETILMHVSGQYIQSTLMCRPVSMDPQKIGSAITYMRRYSLCAVLGLAPEDDDGHSSTNQQPPKPKPVNQPVDKLTQGDVNKRVDNPMNEDIKVEATDWIIPFGKYKDKKLSNVTAKDLLNYADWLTKNAQSSGKPLSDSARTYVSKVEAYCLKNTQDDMPGYDPNDVPF